MPIRISIPPLENGDKPRLILFFLSFDIGILKFAYFITKTLNILLFYMKHQIIMCLCFINILCNQKILFSF